ncbi:MAG: geranylgeranyl reductase family protein [Promethearchaeota archaeon]
MSASSFDVAIVGAGPAGCTAAKTAAKLGLKTIVFDSRKQIGIPVQCGEYLPVPEEMQDLLPNSPRVARLVDVPSAVITNRSSRLLLVSPNNRAYEFRLVSNIIDRAKFDQHLANQAIAAGAQIQLQSTVLKRTNANQLVVKNKSGRQTINAKIIIGADGTQSRIARSIGVRYENRSRDLSPTIQFVMTNIDCDPNTTEMYFGSQIAPGGYAWVIPKDEATVNIGLGFRPAFLKNSDTALSYLHRFINSHPANADRMKNGKILRKTGAIVPVGGPVTRTYFNSVLLVGDAAGHVMASNGGGIPTALGGGEVAGIAAAKHIQENMPLCWYEETWKKEFGQELGSALDILRIADRILTSDNLTNRCMQLAGPRYLQHLIRCRLPFSVKIASKTLVKILALVSK